jgi:type I restriction-modification system DNA methylase subunit
MTEDVKELEQKLWQSADKLRNNMSPSEYKFVVLGLIFLKYISDAFAERYEKAVVDKYDPEDKDWYIAENVFWVPIEARWHTLQDKAKQADIGVVVDDAMDAIERENPILKGGDDWFSKRPRRMAEAYSHQGSTQGTCKICSQTRNGREAGDCARHVAYWFRCPKHAHNVSG